MLHEARILTVEKLVARSECIVKHIESGVGKNHLYKIAVHSEGINAAVLMKNGNIDTDNIVGGCKIRKLLTNTSYIGARHSGSRR